MYAFFHNSIITQIISKLLKTIFKISIYSCYEKNKSGAALINFWFYDFKLHFTTYHYQCSTDIAVMNHSFVLIKV